MTIQNKLINILASRPDNIHLEIYSQSLDMYVGAQYTVSMYVKDNVPYGTWRRVVDTFTVDERPVQNIIFPIYGNTCSITNLSLVYSDEPQYHKVKGPLDFNSNHEYLAWKKELMYWYGMERGD